VSNQAAISLAQNSKSLKNDMKSLSNFKTKTATVLGQLDLPISIYAATERDKFRKPRTAMWSELLEDNNLLAADAVDLENCIFVGDAAGRIDRAKGGVKMKKDHSCGDRYVSRNLGSVLMLTWCRDFAANVGIPFKTPEEFFRDEEPEPFIRPFDPATYLISETWNLSFTKTNNLDIVLFCGSPGSGKSTFYRTQLLDFGYERINQDILKTRDKCLKVAESCLEQGKSVAVGMSDRLPSETVNNS
jgi:bifunctional polynucleotide phosphatase/kinase